MKVYLGADHGGYKMKEAIRTELSGQYEVIDMGNKSFETEDDYTDFAEKVVSEIEIDPDAKGILFCRNGMGMSIAANRHSGIRCGLAFNEEGTRRGRRDDDINVLSLPADYIDIETALNIIKVFLTEPFSREEKYIRRINKIDK